MATFCVCLQCGNVHEVPAADQLPKGWQRSHGDLYCPHCAASDDVLDEEVIYPPRGSAEDTLDEGDCEICDGPCQGH